MFNLGWLEVGLILLVAVLIFGPKNIPELGGTLAKTLQNFKGELQQTQNPNPESEDDVDPS